MGLLVPSTSDLEKIINNAIAQLQGVTVSDAQILTGIISKAIQEESVAIGTAEEPILARLDTLIALINKGFKVTITIEPQT